MYAKIWTIQIFKILNSDLNLFSSIKIMNFWYSRTYLQIPSDPGKLPKYYIRLKLREYDQIFCKDILNINEGDESHF